MDNNFIEGRLDMNKKLNDSSLYRVTYKGEGIYQALRNRVSNEDWETLLNSPLFTWLPKPNIECYTEKCISYFTEKGFTNFIEKTFPIITDYFGKPNNIMFAKMQPPDKLLVYEDKFQKVYK